MLQFSSQVPINHFLPRNFSHPHILFCSYKSAFILIKSNTNGQSFTLSDEMQEIKKKNTEEERMDCILAEELYYVPEEKY